MKLGVRTGLEDVVMILILTFGEIIALILQCLGKAKKCGTI